MAASEENPEIGTIQDETGTLNELRIMPTDSVLERPSTLQAKRSQTPGVAEANTNIGNIFEKVWGFPVEGPSSSQEQVREPEIGHAGMHHGIAHRKFNSGNENKELELQKQIDKNQALIISQQKSFNLLLEKVDNLVKIIQPPQMTDNEQPSVTGYESVSDSDDDEGGRSRSMSPGPSHINTCNMNETRKMLLQMGGDFKKLESTGPKVDENLAEVVNAGISQPIDRKIASALCEKQVRPDNCTYLTVPKINKELWVSSSLYKSLKDNDRKFQTTQGYLTAGLVPLVKLMDHLLKTNQPKEFEMAKDAFQLLAYAHRDITNSRRSHIRPGINEKYKQLCNDNTPLTSNLLGDDLEIQLKSMDTMRKLSTEIGRGKQDFNHMRHQNRKRDYKGAPVVTKQTPSTNHFLWKRSRQNNQPAEKKRAKQFRK